MRHLTALSAAFSLIFLASCGGSGGSTVSPPPPPPPPPPASSAPTITSGASVTIEENTTGIIYTTTANDADGDTVTFKFGDDAAEDLDAALFNLDASTGALSFIDPPNFENPRDRGRGNNYQIDIVATDGTLDSNDFRVDVTITDVPESFKTTRVASLNQPIFTAALPDGTERVVVIGKQGQMTLLTPTGGAYTASSFMDISATISTNGERGLLGIAFSPEFATDETFYVNVTNTSGDTEIRRYQTLAGQLAVGDPASGDVILTVDQPASNHNAGWIGFGGNDLLYIPLGDGGGSGDPNNLAQSPNELLGKVLRIDVSGDDFPADDLRDYRIPNRNTFNPDGSEGRPEIFAVGLRNPFQSSFDAASNAFLIADVGQGAIEEIDVLHQDDTADVNFGWNQREGTQPFNGGADDPSFTPPVAEYGHGNGPNEGRSVTGGLIYTGPVADLEEQYIFADFATNNIWTLPAENVRLTVDLELPGTTPSNRFTNRNADFNPDAGSLSSITGFGTDMNGNLFITTIDGDVFKIEP